MRLYGPTIFVQRLFCFFKSSSITKIHSALVRRLRRGLDRLPACFFSGGPADWAISTSPVLIRFLTALRQNAPYRYLAGRDSRAAGAAARQPETAGNRGLPTRPDPAAAVLTVCLPYFLLSPTGPLLHAWFLPMEAPPEPIRMSAVDRPAPGRLCPYRPLCAVQFGPPPFFRCWRCLATRWRRAASATLSRRSPGRSACAVCCAAGLWRTAGPGRPRSRHAAPEEIRADFSGRRFPSDSPLLPIRLAHCRSGWLLRLLRAAAGGHDASVAKFSAIPFPDPAAQPLSGSASSSSRRAKPGSAPLGPGCHCPCWGGRHQTYAAEYSLISDASPS